MAPFARGAIRGFPVSSAVFQDATMTGVEAAAAAAVVARSGR